MVAETLLEEVEEKRKKTIEMLEAEYSEKKAEVERKAAEQKAYILDSSKKEAEAAAQRERIRVSGAAKLQAKKMLFDATEKMLETNISALEQVLSDFAKSDDYHKMLAKMAAYANKRLGGRITVRCRPADAATLKKHGVDVTSSDLECMGGFKATSADGTLELDLTFEELLRVREDTARALILGKA
jgi:vacuolar-type H+-ATPase subunit E/Vma4